MSPRASAGTPTTFSVAIASVIDREIGLSGKPVAHVLKEAGISRNYYYKRIRGENVFNTNDMSAIAAAIGMDPFELTRRALDEMKKGERLAPVTSIGNVSGSDENEQPDDEHIGDSWEVADGPVTYDGKMAANKGERKADELPHAE